MNFKVKNIYYKTYKPTLKIAIIAHPYNRRLILFFYVYLKNKNNRPWACILSFIVHIYSKFMEIKERKKSVIIIWSLRVPRTSRLSLRSSAEVKGWIPLTVYNHTPPNKNNFITLKLAFFGAFFERAFCVFYLT